MFKKLTIIQRYLLKYRDKAAYQQYKWAAANDAKIKFADKVINHPYLTNEKLIIQTGQDEGHLNISHSGNAGDVIYALATIKKIQELAGIPVNLYLTAGQPLKYTGETQHPLGKVMLDQRMVSMLVPLIQSQPFINQCAIYHEQKIHLDMDHFRNGLIPQDKGNIARWYGYICGVNAELWKPWMDVGPNNEYKDAIVIARSERYRSRKTDYSFLKNYKDLHFIGVESEYLDIKKILPDINWIILNDFMEMAAILKACRFFIGNQSFPFSVAEALKIPRILEASYEVINVVPEGEDAYDFLFQEHFESLVKRLDKKTKSPDYYFTKEL